MQLNYKYEHFVIITFNIINMNIFMELKRD